MKKFKKELIALLVICSMMFVTACGADSETTSTETEASTTETVEAVEETKDNTEDVTTEEPVAEEAASEDESSDIGLEDGLYMADFNTDNSMFHVNETFNGKGVLSVENGKATIHIVLTSTNILNLYEGTVAELDETKLLQPTVETVTYPDGMDEDVNAFDVNVPYLDKEFDLALIGKKGVWYDHKVSVSNPEPCTDGLDGEVTLGEYEAAEGVKVTLEGGTGKSTIESPAKVSTNDEGKQIVTIIWSSPNYDYMIVDGEKILPVNTEGNSTFEIPVNEIPCTIDVIADTVAMSKPHEIEYKITFEY